MSTLQSSNRNGEGAAEAGTKRRDNTDSEADNDDSDFDSNSFGKNGQSNNKADEPQIAKRENVLVEYSRYLVMLVLVLSAGLVAIFTYDYVKGSEEGDFKAQYSNDAKELIDVASKNAYYIFDVLGIFSALLSSSARQDVATWPMYTLPDFEHFGKSARELSGALLIAFTPLVNEAYRDDWERYSVKEAEDWLLAGYDVLGTDYYNPGEDRPPRNITSFVYAKTTRSFVPEPRGNGATLSPCWQLSPAPRDTSIINFNLFNEPTFKRLVEFAIFTRQAAISEVLDTELLFGTSAPQKGLDPQSIVVLPVFEETGNVDSTIIGHVIAVILWGLFFQDVLQTAHDGIHVVLRESCGENKHFTYEIDGPNATFRGLGDYHDPAYNGMVRTARFAAYEGDLSSVSGGDLNADDHCEYTLDLYPSEVFETAYETNRPIVFMVGVLLVFAFTSAVFVLYDVLVGRRQKAVNRVAVKSNAIVASLFPSQVRDKLYQEAEATEKKNQHGASNNPFKRANNVTFLNTAGTYSGGGDNANGGGGGGPGGKMRGGGMGGMMLSHMDDEDMANPYESAPIADLFPSATVLFMDIAGFTSWSSTREPSQVFVLLETIYRSFDKIAKHRHVFKVETIGDCYVAVCGLPEPNEDHAVVMARFARDCLGKMDDLTRKLEVTLGPDTGDLAMRVGMHSGPVTAGVLRGERARFQLFGDTVNTAARMESTGIKKKIQVSQETAELIIASGKSQWIRARNEVVVAKGKGELQTYWLLPKYETASTHAPSEGGSDAEVADAMAWMDADRGRNDGSEHSARDTIEAYNDKIQRLVDYNTDILLNALKKIISRRQRSTGSDGMSAKMDVPTRKAVTKLEDEVGKTGPCLEEVLEVIELPKFDSAAYSDDVSQINVSQDIASELHHYVEMVASMYRNNPFHNFDHASHVTQSTSKLMSRIVAAKHIEKGEQLHDHTYGITSDPLTQFSCILAALVHDVDHRGVPNGLLNKEDPALAAMYLDKAVAEQNSVDVAWNLLMDPQYEKLRRAIYGDEKEMNRFRQLIVNSVMATDIFDKDLAALRKKRWQTAFDLKEAPLDSNPETTVNRKATVVIEHLIQASDVAPTMQHWHVYVKWNHKLFNEMRQAYLDGRSDKDPTQGWYEGELWFFDNYVIPLANKLKECGVFGVSSDEYLNYAEANRREWAKKGKEIVLEKYLKENE